MIWKSKSNTWAGIFMCKTCALMNYNSSTDHVCVEDKLQTPREKVSFISGRAEKKKHIYPPLLIKQHYSWYRLQLECFTIIIEHKWCAVLNQSHFPVCVFLNEWAIYYVSYGRCGLNVLKIQNKKWSKRHLWQNHVKERHKRLEDLKQIFNKVPPVSQSCTF